jgi:60S ribosome subunit biogenesis protein NIP7
MRPLTHEETKVRLHLRTRSCRATAILPFDAVRIHSTQGTGQTCCLDGRGEWLGRGTPDEIDAPDTTHAPSSSSRPSTLQTFFEKLSNYIGRNITLLIDRPQDPHVFRVHRDRVYYVSDQVLRMASSVARDNLLSLGVCFGKFTKSGKFKLHVTALDHLAEYAKYKVWVKPNGEMPYLYGNHVLKAHLGRITQDTPVHQGVVIYSMSDVPLVGGGGIYARHQRGSFQTHHPPCPVPLSPSPSPPGLWRHRPIYPGLPETGPDRHRRLPSNRRWRVPA